jgi:transposase
MRLTKEQWEFVRKRIPKEPGGGRRRHDAKRVIEGILWILKTGARWCDLPKEYPSYQMYHRRFQEWRREGVIRAILEDLAETFIDATFVDAKKGLKIGPTKCGKGTKIVAIADNSSLPISLSIASASPHESTLVEGAIRNRYTKNVPLRIIGDKAYDYDPLDTKLAERYRVRLVAPHKSNRKARPTQDGRAFRRYKRRWKVERLFAWLQNFRRVETRYDINDENYLAFIQLAAIVICLRRF